MYQKIIHRRYRKKRFFYLFACLLILLVITWYLKIRHFDFFHHDREFDEMIHQIARRHTIDPCLVKAVIWRESRFKKEARGLQGEIGLMQIMDGAVKDWADSNNMPVPCKGLRFEPEVNIEIGTWYLARALKYWNREGYANYEQLALCEYNAGRARTKTWLPLGKDDNVVPRITISSTRNYVDSVMGKYFDYSAKRPAE